MENQSGIDRDQGPSGDKRLAQKDIANAPVSSWDTRVCRSHSCFPWDCRRWIDRQLDGMSRAQQSEATRGEAHLLLSG